MHFLQVISIVLALVMLCVGIQDFLISELELLSSALPNNLGCNHTLSFVFTDPNSNNTSATCSSSFTSQNNGTNTAPFSYVKCTPNDNDEFFIWQFNTYSNVTSFNLRLAHEFSDPVNFPPPFNFVEYFADAQINLVCEDAGGVFCTLPDDDNPLYAAVDMISD